MTTPIIAFFGGIALSQMYTWYYTPKDKKYTHKESDFVTVDQKKNILLREIQNFNKVTLLKPNPTQIYVDNNKNNFLDELRKKIKIRREKIEEEFDDI